MAKRHRNSSPFDDPKCCRVMPPAEKDGKHEPWDGSNEQDRGAELQSLMHQGKSGITSVPLLQNFRSMAFAGAVAERKKQAATVSVPSLNQTYLTEY